MRGIGSWLRTLRPIDEAAYLDANPDVRAAIRAGALRSGRQHCRRWGRAEGRPLVPPPPSRRDKLLDGLDLGRMAGVEIGALTSPIVSKQEAGERILYVDHLDTEGLRQKYSDDQLAGATLVDVDRVWGEQTLQDCIGPGLKVDYVLNSHVIEHVPDIVTWLQEIHAILRPDGRLRMAIPDRRYTFDFLRRESTLADALGAYVQRARSPLPRAILDHSSTKPTSTRRRPGLARSGPRRPDPSARRSTRSNSPNGPIAPASIWTPIAGCSRRCPSPSCAGSWRRSACCTSPVNGSTRRRRCT